MPSHKGQLFVIMGVSGCGKSTIGQRLARKLSAQFLEGDDFHPPENVAKMARGVPLTDADRSAWLDNILAAVNGADRPLITLACSALTPYVRQRLSSGTDRQIRWVWLSAPKEVILARMQARKNHFMPPALLDSQYAALSLPDGVIEIDISGDADSALAQILEHVAALPPAE